MRRVTALSCMFAVLVTAPAAAASKDLDQLRKAGVLRVLVPARSDFLERAASPAAAEQALAARFARKLGLKVELIEVADANQLFDELDAGHADLIAASLTETPERQKRALFSRPLRFVKQQLVVKKGTTGVGKLEDLAGKTVTVRGSSASAETLRALAEKVPGLTLAEPEPGEDVYAVLQRVARGEVFATVADSDLLAGALTFEPELQAAFDLTEKDPIGWAFRKGATKLKAAADAFLVEHALTSFKDDAYKADLDGLKKREVLRVLTRNTATTYFLYRGEQLGFEYELMQDFAKSQGLRLEMVVPPDREQLLAWLDKGLGDVVAAGLTATDERKAQFAFATPYNKVSELLVVNAKTKGVESLSDLKGKTVTVRKSSSYYETLAPLAEKHGFTIAFAPEDVETEELLDQVAQGKVFATVADSNIVDVELTYSSDVKSVGPVSDVRPLGWAVRKDQPKLKAALDAYVKKNDRGLFFNMTRNKYFKNAKVVKRATSNERSDVAGKISEWDDIARKYAREYELDWRLVLAQMYQESRFDPKAKSWVGALGLMQVMPATAKDLKISDVVDPDQGTHAGVKLLARYAKLFDSPAIKEKDRIRFALAAYNCGPGHVYDAQRVAKDLKLDPNKWFEHVEKAMLLLAKPAYAKRARHGYCRCGEPVNYVSQIQSRYDSYAKLVPLQ